MPETTSPPPGSQPEEVKLALEDRKLRLEIEKLQSEIEVLKRPSRHPQLRGALLLAAVSLFLAIGQYLRSNHEYILAQIKTERLALDAERLEEKRRSLEAVSKALARENGLRRRALASSAAEFQRAQERLVSTKLTRDQLNGEVRLLREVVARAKNATVGNLPAVASITVTNQAGAPLNSGDTVSLGDQITITPSINPSTTSQPLTGFGWNFDVDLKATPTPPK